MRSEIDNRGDAVAIVGQLMDLAEQVDTEDLIGLAKMHTLCEALATASASDGEDVSAAITDSIHPLVQTLEKLVLGEHENPDAAVASLMGMTRLLHDSSESSGTSSQVAGTSDGNAEEDIAAKLALVFDEEPSETTEPSGEEKPGLTESQARENDTDTSCALDEGRTTPETDLKEEIKPEPPYEPEPLKIAEGEQEFVQAFVEEASEHIESIEASVLEVERAPNDSEKIDTLFRPFHTIKGMAGFLNLRDVNCLTHEVETLLDQGRRGKRTITPGLIDLVFDVVDILKVQISSIATWMANPEGEVIPQPPVVDMIAHLRGVVSGRIEPGVRERGTGSAAQKIGENLVEQGTCPREVVDFALDRQSEETDGRKTGEILVDMGAATPKQISQALRPQGTADAGTGATGGPSVLAEQSVRIDTVKLDALVDMVGELVIAQTQVIANPRIAGDPQLAKNVSQVGKIVRDVQEAAMGMRMIPVGGTFNKMARLVRDVARKANKQVNLRISGEETELDKNVIQQISDPLVHMVRNAVDHGIEPPEGRRAAGKPICGEVHLSAFHHGGNIVIEIRDDGKGMDPKVLIAKGVEKGLIQPGAELTDQQAFQLIFAPGFSLAAKITDISGRGVGMDVVKRNIEQLRGGVEISSELGKGSKFSIRLPLTLAIIDGMVVRVGTERFIAQTITVEQALRPERKQITTVQQKGEVLNVRGRLIPLIQLGSLFGLTDHIDPCDAMVVIAQSDGGTIGLVVEELIGQQQVVIKTLGDRFRQLKGISGAAILGDGRVGLILEMSGLQALQNSRATLSAPSASGAGGGAGGSLNECVESTITEGEPVPVPV